MAAGRAQASPGLADLFSVREFSLQKIIFGKTNPQLSLPQASLAVQDAVALATCRQRHAKKTARIWHPCHGAFPLPCVSFLARTPLPSFSPYFLRPPTGSFSAISAGLPRAPSFCRPPTGSFNARRTSGPVTMMNPTLGPMPGCHSVSIGSSGSALRGRGRVPSCARKGCDAGSGSSALQGQGWGSRGVRAVFFARGGSH